VGWEIDVDDAALEKYKNLKCAYGSVIMESISMEDTPHFVLGVGERCPHLDERGLCRIIMNVGEEYLCDICREHPRFYNFTDVVEVGIGMSCPEAARTVLSEPDFSVMEEIGDLDAEPDGIDFDGRGIRAEIYEILQDARTDYASALATVRDRYCIERIEDGVYLKRLESLEYLNGEHKRLFECFSSDLRADQKESCEYLKRFLAYLIYRHCTEASDMEELCERLAFCLFCEQLLSSLICSENARSLEQVATLASIVSEEIEYSDDNTFELMHL
jgi:hypothetical protein